MICDKEITDEYVRFYAILVTISETYNGTFEVHSACANAYDNAGNWDFDCIAEPCSAATIDPGFYIFKSLTLPKNYTGYIGRFLVYATFYTS